MLQFCTEPVELKLHVKPMVQEGQTASTMKVTMFVEGLERERASERESERKRERARERANVCMALP